MTGRRSRIAAVAVAVVLCLALTTMSIAKPQHATQSWPMFLHDLGRSDYDARATLITPANVNTLKQVWSVQVGGAISDQAASVDGVDYWGSWDGYMHATSNTTGHTLWKTQLGSETDANCYPPHIGITSCPAVATVLIRGRPTKVVFVGGGNDRFKALNATTGKVLWSDYFGAPTKGYFLWSSPALYRGSLYFGVASVGSCPPGGGELVKANPATGKIEARRLTRPRGCVGAGVWGSPTIDVSTGDIYFTTGNDSGFCKGAPEPLAESMVEVKPSLALVGSWRIPNAQQARVDSDFGATPTLFTARIDGVVTPMVGAANKNGIFYAFRRSNVSAGPLWETPRLSTGGEEIASAAWDGSRLYVGGSGTTLDGHHCAATIGALNPANGRFGWRDCLHGGDDLEAVVATPGLVWSWSGPTLYVTAAHTGRILFRWTDPSGEWEYAPVSFSASGVIWGDQHGDFRQFVPRGR